MTDPSGKPCDDEVEPSAGSRSTSISGEFGSPARRLPGRAGRRPGPGRGGARAGGGRRRGRRARRHHLRRPAGPVASIDRPDQAELRMLAVAAEAQGRGVGTALVQACIDQARVDGKRQVTLHTTAFMGRPSASTSGPASAAAPRTTWSMSTTTWHLPDRLRPRPRGLAWAPPPGWRNWSDAKGLKPFGPKGRVGSNPTPGTGRRIRWRAVAPGGERLAARPQARYRRVKVRWVTPLGEETASIS